MGTSLLCSVLAASLSVSNVAFAAPPPVAGPIARSAAALARTACPFPPHAVQPSVPRVPSLGVRPKLVTSILIGVFAGGLAGGGVGYLMGQRDPDHSAAAYGVLTGAVAGGVIGAWFGSK